MSDTAVKMLGDELKRKAEATASEGRLLHQMMEASENRHQQQMALLQSQLQQSQTMMLTLLTKMIDSGGKRGTSAVDDPTVQLMRDQLAQLSTRAERFEERYLELLAQGRQGEMNWPEAIATAADKIGPPLMELTSALTGRAAPQPQTIAEPQTIDVQAHDVDDTDMANEGEDEVNLIEKFRAASYLKEAITQLQSGGTGRQFAIYMMEEKKEEKLYGMIREIPADEVVRLVVQQEAWQKAIAPLKDADKPKALARLRDWITEFQGAYSRVETAAAPAEPKAKKAAAKKR